MPPVQAIGPIQTLLERMTSTDKDFRFMATNDLMSELQKENVRWDDDSETKVTYQIVGLLKDKNGEVQNLAVKCLGHLVKRIKDDRRQLVVKSLCQMLKNDSEEMRDIASIAIKTIVSEMPLSPKMIDIVNNDLNPNLLTAIANNSDVNVQLESLDILTELVNRLGTKIGIFHEQMQQSLLEQLNSERSAIRKRSMNALSNLLACCSEELFNVTIARLYHSLVAVTPTDFEAKTLLQCIAFIVRLAGHRCNKTQIQLIIPVVETFCQVDDDELREYCLQVFEAFVRRCPVNVRKFLHNIIKVCLVNISHDPNYNYNEDGTDDELMEMDVQDDDGSESAEDYSDDDDMSWKVRRASAKCLEAIIVARRDMVVEFLVTIGPVLVSRFKEREESVKSDIIQAFVAILKQNRQSKNEQGIAKLNEMIPTIVAKSSGLLREKAVKARQVVFHMFIEIINTSRNALSEHMASLIPGILYSLSDKNSTSNMKIDALVFVQELIKTHEPSTFHAQVNVITPAVLTAARDSCYKVVSEALTLLTDLITVMRPFNGEPMSDYEPLLFKIYEVTFERVLKTAVDVEIKERAIACMSQIIATFGDKLPNQLPTALGIFHERLNNETTRLAVVKGLIKISNSPLPMSISIFPEAFVILASFLRKTSRPLKISTLILIENVVRRSADLLDSGSIILDDLPNLINESDLYVSQLTLTMLTTVINTHKAFHPIIPQRVIPQTLQLIRSPLLQGSALRATLQFLSTVVKSSFPGLDHSALMSKLLEPIYSGISVHKQAYDSTAKAIAAISTHDQDLALQTAQKLIDDSKNHQNIEGIYTVILYSIGEIGKVTDLSGVPNLVEVLLRAFDSSPEDVKTAGSYALGCIAVGNLNKFLPVILHEIESRNTRQYLILQSLREVISGGHLEQLESVWELLMKHCECPEEGTRNVVSECLGKLTLLKPDVLLDRLINHLRRECADKPLARSTIVAAMKFTISDQEQEIDGLLRSRIGEFLQSLRDEDINVRRVALITFNSAAHNKPSLIIDLLPQILPLLYSETLVKPELIREVEMGPFKHQVDDGLDSRKAAFECMYTLLDTCQSHLDIFEFLTHVENGLRDHYDIKMLTYLILNKLATLCPSEVLQRMDRLVSPIEDVCRTKPKENAVKQEHEKQDELKRSALRALDSLRSIPDADRRNRMA